MKLKDWRKAMMQASRYRYFAHQPIVVLPADICHNALVYIETFQSINVGLWGYDELESSIIRHFTPRPRKPLSTKHHIQAMRKVAKLSKLIPRVS